MRSFAVLALLAGCGFRTHGTAGTGDAPAGGDDAPPQIDGAIDAAMVDARPDAPPDAPPADSDGDGVPDATDNCPMVANADQRDHDADGRGDVCDLCPHIAETVDTDTDSDGVGDACDPHPTTAGDVRLLWVGFYDANDITGWPKQGTWAVANGHLTGGANNTALSYIYEPTSYPHAYAETLAHYNTLGNASQTVSPAAQLYTGDAGQAQYYQCEVAAQSNGNNVVALDVYPINQNHFDQQAWAGTVAANSEIMLHAGVFAGKHVCTATQGATTATVMQDAGGTTGVVVLGTSNANVSFDYLFVVGMP
jgi:hypothetical protein